VPEHAGTGQAHREKLRTVDMTADPIPAVIRNGLHANWFSLLSDGSWAS
jgi:hypothetical protein